MSNLTLRNVSKVYPGEHCVVKDFSLDIKEHEFVIFVGPSGCGKSTTLRMIAGLEDISSGELWIDGELMNYVEPKDRGLSMVFQNYALYPNMTVYGNLAFALKVRKTPKQEIEKRVWEVAQILEIDQLLDRYPKQLSGGQRQRVAIGSAIIREPKIFLMDEPLSNLDAKLRTQMRVEISKLHERLGSTIVYVTHDQTEAMTLGTRIVVMKDGVIQQADTPSELYKNPVNQFVAGFIGSPSMNFVKTRLTFHDGKAWVTVEGTEIALSDNALYSLKNKGCQEGEYLLGIRPEDLISASKAVCSEDVEVTGPVKVRVTARELLGNEAILYFDLGEGQGCARVEPDHPAEAGREAVLYLNRNRLYLFDTDSEESLIPMV